VTEQGNEHKVDSFSEGSNRVDALEHFYEKNGSALAHVWWQTVGANIKWHEFGLKRTHCKRGEKGK